MVDVLKCQILGEVEYAQHNFARLKPLLYSLDGRIWDGAVEKNWFPNAGLVFSLSADLRFAPAGSLWTFQVRPNERRSGQEEGKDAFMTIQVKPAMRFLTELEPLAGEALRRLATVDGFDAISTTGGVLFPEAEDRWILAAEFERGADELARVTNMRALGHMRVLEGTPENICGSPTPDGRWILPVIHSGHGSDIRNWLPSSALAEQIAKDLRRWLPHAPYKARAAAAAGALRELAPALENLSALRSAEVRAALDRVLTLADEAESITESVDELVEALLASPSIANAIEIEKAEIRRDLEAEALESAERLEAAARDRLAEEQAEMRAALEREQTTLEALRAEIAEGEKVVEDIRRRQRVETATFTRSLEALIARAKKEPAAYAAEWLVKAGLTEAAGVAAPRPAASINPIPLPLLDEIEQIAEAELGPALNGASPIRNEGMSRFHLMDAAVRGRELVVGVGPQAREVIETWLFSFAPLAVVARVADPTLLCFDDLLPTGSRGATAPLAVAIERANGAPNRAVVALLDDIDVAAGGFWLPQAARAMRRPHDHGLPANLFLIGLVEGEPSSFGLGLVRAGELFPLSFEDVARAPNVTPRAAREVPLALFSPPLALNGIDDRVAALAAAASYVFNDADAASLGKEFRAYLEWAKSGGDKPPETMSVAGALVVAALSMRKGDD